MIKIDVGSVRSRGYILTITCQINPASKRDESVHTGLPLVTLSWDYEDKIKRVPHQLWDHIAYLLLRGYDGGYVGHRDFIADTSYKFVNAITGSVLYKRERPL